MPPVGHEQPNSLDLIFRTARDARSRDKRIGARSELHFYRGFDKAKPASYKWEV
jgi:hypothetical protein